jgi:hypothetical protein
MDYSGFFRSTMRKQGQGRGRKRRRMIAILGGVCNM